MLRLPIFLAIVVCCVKAEATRPALVDAVRNRDASAVRELLRTRAVVDARDPDGATALHWAAFFDDVDTAKALLAAGADARAANDYGATPLSLACLNGSAPMIELLLKSGADPNSASPEGETALMTAARTGKLDAVKVLLKNGANVHAKENWHKQTALMWAAAEGHLPVVEILIEYGANIAERSEGGFSPLLFAVREGRAEVVKALLKAGASPNEKLPPRRRRTTGASEFRAPEGGASALDLAVANAHFELASQLLDAGADPNEAQQGWTPLHTVTWVRKPGAGSNAPSPPGSGNMDSLELVRRLAAHGANLNARMTRRSSAGLSALHMIGATPFLMAARTGDAELMRLLASLGADPLLPNEENSTPLMVAAGLGTRSPGEDAGTEAEVLEAVKAAIELGNDVNAVDDNGETAMHGAAYKNLPEVVRYLARAGARIDVWNRKNKNGWTPLRIAEGVHRTGNFRSSEPTAAAIREVMIAAGVAPVADPEAAPGSGR